MSKSVICCLNRLHNKVRVLYTNKFSTGADLGFPVKTQYFTKSPPPQTNKIKEILIEEGAPIQYFAQISQKPYKMKDILGRGGERSPE